METLQQRTAELILSKNTVVVLGSGNTTSKRDLSDHGEDIRKTEREQVVRKNSKPFLFKDGTVQQMILNGFELKINCGGVWEEMWKVVLEKLFPQYIVEQSVLPLVSGFKYLFLTVKKPDIVRDTTAERIGLLVCGFYPAGPGGSGKIYPEGFLRGQKLAVSHLSKAISTHNEGKLVPQRIYYLGFIGPEFGWGWVEDGQTRAFHSLSEWENLEDEGSHGSLFRLADLVKQLLH